MILGIDIGGSHIKSAIIDENYNLSEKRSTDTPQETTPNNLIQLITEIIQSYAQDFDFEKVGIGYPAAIDKDGNILDTPNIKGVNNISLKEQISQKTNKSVYVINDANAAALSELKIGVGVDLNNFIMLTLGTGIGGSIVINNNLFTGDLGTAGEFGFSLANFNTNEVKIFEKVFSKSSILEIANKNSALFPNTIFNGIDEFTPKELSDAVKIGDDLAILTLSESGLLLGRGLASIVNILGITNVIFGGGLSKLNEILFIKAKSEMNAYLIEPLKGKVHFLYSKYENDSGMIGAAINAENLK